MRNCFLVVLIGLLFLLSCNSRKSDNSNDEQVMQNKVQEQIIQGIVQEVIPGKDGYTLNILTDARQTYYAVVSIPNLGKNASQFRQFVIGEKIHLKGKIFKMGDQQRMVVTEIFP